MKQKRTLRFMFHLFCTITTFETLFITMDGLIGSGEFLLSSRDLFRIPFVAFMSVLPVPILLHRKDAKRVERVIRNATHFILTAGIVFGLLIYFKWLDAGNAAAVAAFFLVIYGSATAIAEIRAKKLADKLNERLSAFHDAENATHRERP